MRITLALRLPCVVVLMALLVASPSFAAKKKKKGGKSGGGSPNTKIAVGIAKANWLQAWRESQSMADAARQRVGVAESKLDLANAKLNSLKTLSQDAQAKIVAAQSRMRAIEQQIDSAEPSDSALGRLLEEEKATRRDLQQARHGILKSPSYLAEYEAAKKAGDQKLIASLANDTLQGNAEYVAALAAQRNASTRLGQLRQEMYAKNAEWTAARTEIFSAMDVKADAAERTKTHVVQRFAAISSLKYATNALNAASGVAAQAQATLKVLGHTTSPADSNYGSSATSGTSQAK